MCQGWGNPEDRKITLRGCCALRQQHGRIICHHNCYVGSKRASLLGNKHFLISNKQQQKINENIKLEYMWRSRFSTVRLRSLLSEGLSSISGRATGLWVREEKFDFLICASIPPPVKWSQWYRFLIRSSGEKSDIRKGYSLFFPTQTQAVMPFPNILSNK